MMAISRRRIEGNCDERGTSEYNMALGDRRAASVKKYLAAPGIDSGRLSTVSYGKERPACAEHNEECWQRNRRADLVLLKQGTGIEGADGKGGGAAPLPVSIFSPEPSPGSRAPSTASRPPRRAHRS